MHNKDNMFKAVLTCETKLKQDLRSVSSTLFFSVLFLHFVRVKQNAETN